jgi:preprotein translocase subunit Sec61beta
LGNYRRWPKIGYLPKNKRKMTNGGSLRMPSGGGGLVRYFEEYKSKIQLKPEHVVLLIILVVVFEIVLRIL